MMRLNRLKRIFALCLCVCMGVCLLPAFAQEEARNVRVGYIDYDGFINAEADGTYSGYGVELLDEIAAYTGWTYTYVYDTWPNQLANLASGEIDFICHAQQTHEREETYLFSKYATGSETSVLYARQDDARFYYNDFTSFDGMKVGFLANSFQNDEFDQFARENGFTYTAKEYDTQAQTFDALTNGEVDTVAMGSLAGISGYKVISRFGSDPFYFMTGKQNGELLTQLDSALGQIHAVNPTFEASLYTKYYGAASASTSLLYTREEAEYIASSGTITVGLMAHRSPLSVEGEDGSAKGITVDLMNLVAKKSGLSFDYAFLTDGQTGMQFMQETGADMVAGIMSSDFSSPNPILLKSKPLMTGSIVFVGKSGMEFSADSQLTIAMPAGFIGGEKLIASIYPNFSYYHGVDNEDCLTAIREGKADVMLQNVYVIREALQSPRFSDLQMLMAYSFDEDMCVVMQQENALLMSIINKTIDTITSDERNDIILANTIGKVYNASLSDTLYKYRMPLFGIAVLVLVVLALLIAFIAVRQRASKRLSEVNHNLTDANDKLADLNSKLREAVNQAERANVAKSQFLSRMSHEIRTPMNAIVGLTTIARSHENDPEKIEDYLIKIDSSSRVLLNIINDVLDMSAIESAKMKIAENEFDLKQVLNGISTIYYAQCKQKGVEFVMAADLQNETVIGDALRVNQVLMNLVSNAYKFTPAGGRIEITARQMEKREDKVFVRFTVKDTGCGMTEEMKTRLFKPFEQESAATAQKTGGSGLGMSIAKNLVDLMHGAISVESEKGKGTAFTVDLPFHPTTHKNLIDASKLKNMRAMVVDDDENACLYTSTVLERIGIAYDTAASGAEAIEKMEKAQKEGKRYDLCFVDWRMPGMSGVELTEKIRANYNRDMVVIIVSAYDLSEVEEQAKKAGADMFIQKPLFQSSVFNALVQLTGGIVKKEEDAEKEYHFGGKRLLLAEDNDLNAEIAGELLDMVDLKNDRAENGQIAVDKFTSSAPGTYELILMDIQMPIMDGYQAARAIRASSHPQAKTIPIFAMTANAFTEDVSSALSAGMNGHIAKPIDTKVLYRTIARCIK